MVAAEAIKDKHEIQIERPVILPAVLEIPDRLLSRLRIGGVERRVGEGLAADVVVDRAVALELHLRLVLLGAVGVVLARHVAARGHDLHLELGKVELVDIDGRDEWT